MPLKVSFKLLKVTAPALFAVRVIVPIWAEGCLLDWIIEEPATAIVLRSKFWRLPVALLTEETVTGSVLPCTFAVTELVAVTRTCVKLLSAALPAVKLFASPFKATSTEPPCGTMMGFAKWNE